MCTLCGSLLSTRQTKRNLNLNIVTANNSSKETCFVCQEKEGYTRKKVQKICVPYSFRYLTAELAAMNIKVKLDLCEVGH